MTQITKSAPEDEVVLKAENGTEARKKDFPNKPKAVAKSERKSPLSQTRGKVATDTKPKERKAIAPKRANNANGNKKFANKQQRRRKPNGKARPSPTEPARPVQKGKKKQQTTTIAPIDEEDYPAEEYPDAKDVQNEEYDDTYEAERRTQKPRKKGRRPPPRVIVVVHQPPPVPGPRPKFPFLQTTPYPGQYTPYDPYLKYGTSPPSNGNEYNGKGNRQTYQTTLPPGYYSNDDVDTNSNTNPPWKTAKNQNTYYPYAQSTYYSPYYWNNSSSSNNYYQFWTTYYPNYNWTKFYGDSAGTASPGYYDYTTMPPAYYNNKASPDDYSAPQTQYYNSRGSSLPGYFPNYNWTSIYGQYTSGSPNYWSPEMPYNRANMSSRAQYYDASTDYSQQMFKNSTGTTPEPSTNYSIYGTNQTG